MLALNDGGCPQRSLAYEIKYGIPDIILNQDLITRNGQLKSTNESKTITGNNCDYILPYDRFAAIAGKISNQLRFNFSFHAEQNKQLCLFTKVKIEYWQSLLRRPKRIDKRSWPTRYNKGTGKAEMCRSTFHWRGRGAFQPFDQLLLLKEKMTYNTVIMSLAARLAFDQLSYNCEPIWGA